METGNNEQIEPEEIKIPVPWGHVSGKWWGPKFIQPVVTLHGREDNSGSFDTLMPKLCKNQSYLCLDLPGHGLSSHLHEGQYYFVYWQGVMLLRRVVRHFQWNKVKIMGHSMGGAIGFLYAASYPKDVEVLICLDIAGPLVRDDFRCVEMAGDQIDKCLAYEKSDATNRPTYDYDSMIDIVEDAYKGSITRAGAEILLKRGSQPSPIPGQYYFTRDPRLKVSYLGNFNGELLKAFAEKITCAYLNIKADKGSRNDGKGRYPDILDTIKKSADKFEYHEFEGTHHMHLNDPETVAPVIMNFLKSLMKNNS
ncbi:probable serine hydrolase [Fopius arisanus]|uniref:Probable serine hydrolase n=2 Tax=Fopius arisanus TaxID=64838 RepID=A0A9R1U596_9HYME|nr:PREDICTED: probable serine hydrolase [Fopius arisanus]